MMIRGHDLSRGARQEYTEKKREESGPNPIHDHAHREIPAARLRN